MSGIAFRSPGRVTTFLNDTGADLAQDRLCLDPEIVWVGEITDPDGIVDEARGFIDCNIGRYIRTSQFAATDFVTGAIGDPVYMAPGAGNVLSETDPLLDNYLIGKLTEAKTPGQDVITFQIREPLAVDHAS